MEKFTKGFLYVLVLSGVIYVLVGSLNHIFFRDKIAVNHINVHSGNLGEILIQLEGYQSPHPYGKAVQETLNWEDDSTFLRLKSMYGATLRMAAFQITLLDPLPGEKFNVVLAANMLAGTVIGPGEYFSYNQTVGPFSKERGFKEGPIYSGNSVAMAVGGGVCKVATTLYNAAVLANMDISERHPHGMLVPYVYPGQDATVSYGIMDFSFKNVTDHPLVIWAATEGDVLTVAIYGNSPPPKVTWHHELLSWQRKHTIYRYNPDLPPGREKVIIPGAGSVAVKVWLTVENPDGTIVTKDLGVIYYNPMPRVIEKVFVAL